MEETNMETKGSGGWLLFLIDYAEKLKTAPGSHYVMALSHEDAAKLFKHRWGSLNTIRITLVASELQHPSVPVSARLLVGG